MTQRHSNQILPKLITWIVLLAAVLLVAACVAPASEVADEADMSADEAAALAEAEGEGEDAVEDAVDAAEETVEETADEAEKAVDDAADEAEKALDDAADAFESSLRNFEELDADASQEEVDSAFAEFNAASEELVAIAAAEGADANALEAALDELEQQIRDSMESGNPLEFQQDFLNAWFDAISQ